MYLKWRPDGCIWYTKELTDNRILVSEIVVWRVRYSLTVFNQRIIFNVWSGLRYQGERT